MGGKLSWLMPPTSKKNLNNTADKNVPNFEEVKIDSLNDNLKFPVFCPYPYIFCHRPIACESDRDISAQREFILIYASTSKS